jgi:UDP-N-acetylglucosamine acyltransferase
VIGPEVEIGAGTIIANHVTLQGPLKMGAGNNVFPYASLGLPPQDLKFKGERTQVVIGERNTFREYVTVNRGTAGGGGLTTIGSDNLFMAYAHVAHDCHVGNHTIFANAATLAGHVDVHDCATVGAFSAVHQFCRVGAHAYLGGFTVATQDALPYSRIVGNRACLYGLNTIGLVRRGFSRETVRDLKHAFALLMHPKLNTTAALARLEEEGRQAPEVRLLIDFIRSAKRGVVVRRAARGANGITDEDGED